MLTSPTHIYIVCWRTIPATVLADKSDRYMGCDKVTLVGFHGVEKLMKMGRSNSKDWSNFKGRSDSKDRSSFKLENLGVWFTLNDMHVKLTHHIPG